MDYRMAIVNMSKHFPHMRFSQFIANAIGDSDLFYLSDEELYMKCKAYSTFISQTRVFIL